MKLHNFVWQSYSDFQDSRSMRWGLLLVALLPVTAVRDFAVREELRQQEIPDGFDDFFTHFHVTPETHRAILPEHGDAGVTLSVAFALHPVASVLGISLPPGYVLTETVGKPSQGCSQIFAPYSEEEKSPFANETKAQLLTEHVTSCEVTNSLDAKGNSSDLEQKDAVVQLTLILAPDVPQLSKREVVPNNSSSIVALKWWYFHIRVLYPDRSPEAEDNRFLLHWASESEQIWEGETWIQAWPILGDWNCVYSDWEGWGSCSTRCGGGQRMLTRKVLLQPPSGDECTDTVHPDPGSCNEHPCLYHCKFKEEEVIQGACSASCGGGVRFSRKRFYIDGENFDLCPQMGDQYSEQLELCNTQPCKARCELSNQWEPVTPCDAACGKGHFKVMRKVLQKEMDDQTCIPEYKWLPCERQNCTEFTVSRAEPTLIPMPSDRIPLILSWAQTTLARKITIRAPIGYKFGEQVGDSCGIQFHSLHPHMESCKVTDQLNTVELDFAIPLPPAWSGGAQSGPAKGRYELSLYVYTPECKMERWVADPIRHAIICNEQPDRTRWVIEFLESPGDAGAEIKDALGFLMEYREGSGIQLPQDLKMKAEQMLLDDAPPSKEVTNSTPAPDLGRKQNGWVLCMGVNDIGFCKDRSGRSDMHCGWQDVCEVKVPE